MKFRSLIYISFVLFTGIAPKHMFPQSYPPPMVKRALFVPHNDQALATLQDAFPAGLAISPGHVQQYAPPVLRVRKEAGFFLASSQSIVLYDDSAQRTTQWDLSPELESLIDFATHPDGLKVLWRNKGRTEYVTSFDSQGKQTAVMELFLLEQCSPTQVLLAPTRMFVHFQGTHCNSLSENGEYGKSHSNGEVYSKLFPVDELSWGGLGYVGEKGLDACTIITPGEEQGKQEIQSSVWPQRHGVLLGIDGSGAFILRGLQSLTGTDNLVRVGPKGNVLGSLPLSGLVCSENGSQIALYAWEAGGLRLHYFGDSSRASEFYPIEKSLMERLQNARCAGEVDAKGVVALHFGDEMGSYGTTLHLHHGKVEALHLEQPFLTSRLSSAPEWQVTREGKVLVPIATPSGVVVVSIQF